MRLLFLFVREPVRCKISCQFSPSSKLSGILICGLDSLQKLNSVNSVRNLNLDEWQFLEISFQDAPPKYTRAEKEETPETDSSDSRHGFLSIFISQLIPV